MILKAFHDDLDESLKPLEKKLSFIRRFQIELRTGLNIFVHLKTVGARGSTLGQRILNLCFRSAKKGEQGSEPDNKKQKKFPGLSKEQVFGLAFFSIIVPYLRQRLGRLVPSSGKLFTRLDDFERVVELVCLLVFIVNGVFPNPVCRLLSLTVKLIPQKNRVMPDLKLIIRNLLFNILIDAILSSLTAIDVSKLKERITNFVKRSPNVYQDTSLKKRTEEDLKICVICREFPNLPQEIGCRHVFCFFCINADIKRSRNSNYSCPACRFQISDRSEVKFLSMRPTNS